MKTYLSFLTFVFFIYSHTFILSQVGIGTTTPAEELDINGDLRVSGGINFSSSSTFLSNTFTVPLAGTTITAGQIPDGLVCMFIASSSNTGPSNIIIDNGSEMSNSYNIVKRGQILLSEEDIIAGELVMVIFNGTDFQLVQQASIPSYLTDCGGTLVNTLSDNDNCGSCGNACPAGYVCVDGSCVLTCQSGLINCNGMCTNLLTDVYNCGNCGVVCPSNSVCVDGSCVLNCPIALGFTICSGECIDLKSDNNNCGSCGNACPAGFVCNNGTCILSCQSGLTKCTNTCVNLLTDTYNCGSCGIQCSQGEICVNGVCVLICQSGLVDCSGICRDLDTDNNNCGDCGVVCPAGQCCVNGECV